MIIARTSPEEIQEMGNTQIRETKKTVKELRKETGMEQKEFAKFFHIPYRTVQNWESNSSTAKRNCPQYVIDMMAEILDR